MSDNKDYRNIYKKLLTMPKIDNIDDGLKLVQTGKYALLVDEAVGNTKVGSNCDTFAIADERFYASNFGFILPENSPYLKFFNTAYVRLFLF